MQHRVVFDRQYERPYRVLHGSRDPYWTPQQIDDPFSEPCRDTTFQQVQFTGLTFRADDLQRVAFHDCTFDRCHFLNADYPTVEFLDCRFLHCSMEPRR